jgi:hypothetical protein
VTTFTLHSGSVLTSLTFFNSIIGSLELGNLAKLQEIVEPFDISKIFERTLGIVIKNEEFFFLSFCWTLVRYSSTDVIILAIIKQQTRSIKEIFIVKDKQVSTLYNCCTC